MRAYGRGKHCSIGNSPENGDEKNTRLSDRYPLLTGAPTEGIHYPFLIRFSGGIPDRDGGLPRWQRDEHRRIVVFRLGAKAGMTLDSELAAAGAIGRRHCE
jgi:hypothetical protein